MTKLAVVVETFMSIQLTTPPSSARAMLPISKASALVMPLAGLASKNAPSVASGMDTWKYPRAVVVAYLAPATCEGTTWKAAVETESVVEATRKYPVIVVVATSAVVTSTIRALLLLWMTRKSLFTLKVLLTVEDPYT